MHPRSGPQAQHVESFGDTVTLRGTIGSFAQRRAAVADARRTRGVVDVYDEVDVRILDRRQDAEIRGAALQRLSSDSEIPGDYLDVRVEDGRVTLKGEVDYQFQSDLAFDDVSRLYGVTGVTNETRSRTSSKRGRSASSAPSRSSTFGAA